MRLRQRDNASVFAVEVGAGRLAVAADVAGADNSDFDKFDWLGIFPSASHIFCAILPRPRRKDVDAIKGRSIKRYP